MSEQRTAAPLQPMTSEEFVAWATEQSETDHHELYRGEVVPMPAERALDAITKTLIGRRLGNAIEELGLNCTVIVDSFMVRVDGETSFEPDVVVCCGPPPASDALWIDDPLIVVEVLPRSIGGVDKSVKLADYMKLVSVRHYLIVDAHARRVIHHARDTRGNILSSILGDGPILLDPPGLTIDRFFPAA